MAIKREDLKVGGKYICSNYSKVTVKYIGKNSLFYESKTKEKFSSIDDFLLLFSKPKIKVKFDFYIHYYSNGQSPFEKDISTL
jgi:hypothetical protein